MLVVYVCTLCLVQRLCAWNLVYCVIKKHPMLTGASFYLWVMMNDIIAATTADEAQVAINRAMPSDSMRV